MLFVGVVVDKVEELEGLDLEAVEIVDVFVLVEEGFSVVVIVLVDNVVFQVEDRVVDQEDLLDHVFDSSLLSSLQHSLNLGSHPSPISNQHKALVFNRITHRNATPKLHKIHKLSNNIRRRAQHKCIRSQLYSYHQERNLHPSLILRAESNRRVRTDSQRRSGSRSSRSDSISSSSRRKGCPYRIDRLKRRRYQYVCLQELLRETKR